MPFKTSFGSRRAFLVLDDSVAWRSLSLEAIGLWVHVEAQANDILNVEALQAQFPTVNVSALVAELVKSGILFDSALKSEALPEEPIEARAEEERPGPKRPGFVYVIASSGYYKIGVTRNLTARRKQLQTGHYAPLEFVWHRHCVDPAALELRLHTILQPLRQSGEWFSCTQEQLDAALQLGILGHEEIEP